MIKPNADPPRVQKGMVPNFLSKKYPRKMPLRMAVAS